MAKIKVANPVVELDGDSTLLDAARAVSRAGVGAIVCRIDESRDPQVMLRDEMLNITDWQPLIDARSRRQGQADAPLRASPPAAPNLRFEFVAALPPARSGRNSPGASQPDGQIPA